MKNIKIVKNIFSKTLIVFETYTLNGSPGICDVLTYVISVGCGLKV